jgi:hypothetical protein
MLNTVTFGGSKNFFLVSETVTQGTVSPTFFNVVEDSTRMLAETHQCLAYALSHLYYNLPVRYTFGHIIKIRAIFNVQKLLSFYRELCMSPRRASMPTSWLISLASRSTPCRRRKLRAYLTTSEEKQFFFARFFHIYDRFNSFT